MCNVGGVVVCGDGVDEWDGVYVHGEGIECCWDVGGVGCVGVGDAADGAGCCGGEVGDGEQWWCVGGVYGAVGDRWCCGDEL